MTLGFDDKKALIQHRIDRAKATKKEAVLLYENGMSAASVNRAYYSMFYALTALALTEGYQSSKHGQLIGWFNRHFIKQGLVDRSYSRIITRAFNKRMEGDYEDFTEFFSLEVQDILSECDDFINMVQNFLQSKNT